MSFNLLYSRYARLLRALHDSEGLLTKEQYHHANECLREAYRALLKKCLR